MLKWQNLIFLVLLACSHQKILQDPSREKIAVENHPIVVEEAAECNELDRKISDLNVSPTDDWRPTNDELAEKILDVLTQNLMDPKSSSDSMLKFLATDSTDEVSAPEKLAYLRGACNPLVYYRLLKGISQKSFTDAEKAKIASKFLLFADEQTKSRGSFLPNGIVLRLVEIYGQRKIISLSASEANSIRDLVDRFEAQRSELRESASIAGQNSMAAERNLRLELRFGEELRMETRKLLRTLWGHE